MRATIALLIWLLPSAAFAQGKIALLIGNQAYDKSVGILRNSHNDIAVVGEALRAQNFDVLPPIKDASRSAILGGVRELVRRLIEAGTGSIGFVYYSGHGAAEKGTNINYLIPVNAKQPGTDAFWDDSLKLDDVLRLLDGARSAAKIVVFDACRNELQLPTKDTSKGLIPVAEQEGLFVAYASSPGRTASDRGDKSGVYAAALAAELLRPGLDHLNLFQNVKESVLASTNGVQQPWESNGLNRRVYLTGQPNLDPALVPRVNEAMEIWDRTKDTKEVALLEALATRYKDTFYAELARARIDALQKKSASLRPSQLGTETWRPFRLDDEALRTLAKEQGILLPPTIRIAAPNLSIPTQFNEYLGAWGGNERWNGEGRQIILIVTSVGRLGQVTGVYAEGPPNRATFNQTPSRYANFNGKLSEDGLKFIAWSGAWKYEFKVMPDGSMTGRNQGPPPHAGSRIALARVAAGTPLEPSTANPFDGIWDIVRHGTNCGSANTYTAVLIIENGIVFGEMGAGEVQGSVSPSGTFRLAHPSVSGGPGATQMHSGRLEGARGSGTFHHSSNSCKGTFTMNRR
jgi:hypothetical protein